MVYNGVKSSRYICNISRIRKSIHLVPRFTSSYGIGIFRWPIEIASIAVSSIVLLTYIDVHSRRARKVARKLRTIVQQIPITARWARSRSVFPSGNPDHRIDVREEKKRSLFRPCIPTAMDYLVAHHSFRARSLRSFPISDHSPFRAVKWKSDFWSLGLEISATLCNNVAFTVHPSCYFSTFATNRPT